MNSLWIGAALVLATSSMGCGGSPCAEYCSVTLDCALKEDPAACSADDAAKSRNACTDACNKGVAAVDSGDQAALNTCIDCLAGAVGDTCSFEQDTFLKCQEPCSKLGQASFTTFSQTFSQEIEKVDPVCGGGSSSDSCDYSEGGDGMTDMCSVECSDSNGDVLYGATCSGPAGGEVTCTCTGGSQSGATFTAADCTLDSDLVKSSCD